MELAKEEEVIRLLVREEEKKVANRFVTFSFLEVTFY